jgi:hypothetical protein
MANLQPKTEAFDDTGEWTPIDSLTITASTGSPPTFAGINATGPDTLTDAQASSNSALQSGFHTIPNDTSANIFSIYLAKDTSTTRFPGLYLDFVNGTRIQIYMCCDTKNGLITTFADLTGFAADASGVDDVDANWWRFWIKKANNATGNTQFDVRIFAALSTTYGGSSSVSAQGSIVAWGANVTNSATLQPYEPDPTYAFVFAALSVNLTEPILGESRF